MKIETIFWIIPFAGFTALVFSFFIFKKGMKESPGTKLMQEIASYVTEGTITFARQYYKIVAKVFVVLFILLLILAAFNLQSFWVTFAFLTGAFFSGLTGYLGMRVSTYMAVRVTNAARTSLNKAFVLAFRSGGVVGLMIVGIALLDISFWYKILDYFIEGENTIKLIFIATTMLSFGMGASGIALFARVGGGNFTKANDVGADSVGKNEFGIPEDDPRNAAVIADNVGDNVGDIAGMGGDLYESYVGSIISTSVLGTTIFIGNYEMQLKAFFLPLLISAMGIFFSIISIFLVKAKEDATIKQLQSSLNRGMNFNSIFVIISAFFWFYFLNFENWLGFSLSVVIGLLAGIIIGKSTEYFTSSSYKPTKKVAKSSESGTATGIIAGFGNGMISTIIPITTIGVAIYSSYYLGNLNGNHGIYGVGMAAVGMLSILAFTLATDAYGPIVDNAGGNAEMAKLGKEVRERTDKLDALGNTTAAITKGFAIGSAALTSLCLLVAYVEEEKIALMHIAKNSINGLVEVGNKILTIEMLQNMTNLDMMNYYNMHFLNPQVITSLFLGGMIPFIFSGMILQGVDRVAQKIVKEVSRQFKEIIGLLEGKTKANYSRCVIIGINGALKEMLLPAFLAIISPIAIGLTFGFSGVMSFLVGALITGIPLSIFSSNAGGSWDNSKKHIEAGNLGGKGSNAHKSAVVGDTVGDPLKDSSGPSLNILLKLMSMVSIITVFLITKYHIF